MAREMERLKEENEASHRRAKSLEGRLHEHQEREDKERRMREKEKRAAQKTEGGGEALVRRERRKGRRDMVGEEERGTTEDSRDGESASSKSTSPVRKPVDLMARHAVRFILIGSRHRHITTAHFCNWLSNEFGLYCIYSQINNWFANECVFVI